VRLSARTLLLQGGFNGRRATAKSLTSALELVIGRLADLYNVRNALPD
jgi:hypothetical protein